MKSNTVKMFIYCHITCHTRQSASQSFISKSPKLSISLNLINNTGTVINQIKYKFITSHLNFFSIVHKTFNSVYNDVSLFPFFFGCNQRNSTQNKLRGQDVLHGQCQHHPSFTSIERDTVLTLQRKLCTPISSQSTTTLNTFTHTLSQALYICKETKGYMKVIQCD